MRQRIFPEIQYEPLSPGDFRLAKARLDQAGQSLLLAIAAAKAGDAELCDVYRRMADRSMDDLPTLSPDRPRLWDEARA
jgi:hypothetical protein